MQYKTIDTKMTRKSLLDKTRAVYNLTALTTININLFPGNISNLYSLSFGLV